MLFRVEPHSSVPIYEQIVTQVTFAVAAGSLAPGELVPSVRELAQQLVVNPNTVARAYQELERRRVLIALRGRGMEVAREAPRVCQQGRQAIVRQGIREALREAVSSGLAAEEIRETVEEELRRATNGRKARTGS